ncbi:RNA polymerase II transcription mediator [Wolffia australiana]
MWTNVYKIGGFQVVSWFQFLPYEQDPSSLREKSQSSNERDPATRSILASHLRLQNEGFLSTWSSSFVGPWDPSQGAHNPDEKIKLWLFLPGCYSSVSESARNSVSRLRVIANGVWSAPGDSEEVGLALSQCLRNRIERSLRALNFVRFGDVFTKCPPLSSSEKNFRRVQPSCEFIFMATDEAIFVHVLVSAKHICSLPGDDVKRALKYFSNGKNGGLPVISAPNGLRGRLVGICPADLVNQVYLSKVKSLNDSNGGGMPSHFSQYSSSRSKEQNCCIEVAMGDHQLNMPRKCETEQGSSEVFSTLERTLIYPVEAVVVPLLYKAFSKCSPKRFWLHNRVETTLSDAWTLWDSSEPSLTIKSVGLESATFMESINDDSDESGLKQHQRYNSSSNSNGSSRSSISSTSSGSENMTSVRTRELEADADSVTCAQSGSSRNEQTENNGRKVISKRPRAGSKASTDKVAAFAIEAMQGTYKSELSAGETNSSVSEAIVNTGIGSYWDSDDGDYGINIQSLLSEYGDFSDFFVNDILCFGEPPGTAESQTLNVAQDGSDSPCNAAIDQDQLLLKGLNQIPLLTRLEEPDHRSSIISSDEFRLLSEAEAAMTFAPEYAAVETTTGNFAPIFRTAYVPLSRKAENSNSCSGNYSYNATPPTLVEPSEEKSVAPPCYTQISSGRKFNEKNAGMYLQKEDAAPSSISGITSSFSHHTQGKNKIESMWKSDDRKTSLATDVECMMLQASMCRIRHTLLSCAKQNQSSGRNELIRKELVPVRIAGDVDGGSEEKTVSLAVGVWRSVGTTKAPKSVNAIEDSLSTSTNVQMPRPLEALLNALPLVVQQSTSFVDVTLDACDGDEPYTWLAFQEQQRRGFSCGPLMTHAGCGGLLASCHSLDIAGIELNDPLSADVQASFVTSFLQSDIKVALRNAFGNFEGPLSLIDFCKGGGLSVDNVGSELRDSSLTPRGESISSPQALSISSSLVKDGSAVGESVQRRIYNENSTPEREQLNTNARNSGSISLVPFPAFLVGYQDDWLKTSSSSLEVWEKGPLEPYALPKPITYYAICPDIDLLTYAAIDFILQLGTVYETCKLGTHSPIGSAGPTDQNCGKSSSGLILLECPPSLKGAGRNISSISSVSDFFGALESAWDVSSYLNALTKALKNLKLMSTSGINQKDIKGGSCTVVYVVCPFPEPTAVLQTVVEASATLGSSYFSADKERRSLLQTQVSKALSGVSAFDEASTSSLLVLSGFNMSKLVLQIVTIDSLLRVKPGNELAMLKEYAFSVYNKARRVPRSFASAGGTLWKENLDSRWDGSSWQTLRSVDGSFSYHDDIRFLYEPLFILSEPSSIEQGVSCLSSPRAEDLLADGLDSTEAEARAPSLHCCYGWTEDWRWMVCIWTDSRGELLDSQVFPFGGICGRQDTKLLQCLFVQMLHHGCHILSCCSSDSGLLRPRDLVISRLGSFFELERQEWQRAIYLVGGNEVKKWAVQLRGSQGGGAASGLPQEVGAMAERPLPSSPSSLYSPHAKIGYVKPGASPQVSAKKPVLFQFLQSITLVSILVDHSLQLMLPATDSPLSGYVEGFSAVKSVGAMQGAYIIIPSPSLRHLPTTPLQLPISLTSESPPIAHLLHSKGPSLPIASAFVVSKAVSSGGSCGVATKDEWPSVLLVGLVDHYGNAAEKLRAKQEAESNAILETVAADLHSLSWMTASPLHLRRRTPLPFHCHVLLRLRRLLHFADRELLSRPPDALSP